MMAKSTSQPSLFSAPGSDAVRTPEGNHRPTVTLTLNQWEWLDLLADDWWPLNGGDGFLTLGVNQACSADTNDNTLRVIAWIELAALPDIEVSVWRNDAWDRVRLGGLGDGDSQIIWPGPIPLASVIRFSVGSGREKDRLLALSRSFSNLTAMAIDVEIQNCHFNRTIDAPPGTTRRLHPPANWNAARGAAAMAAWAVPGITPWIELFSDSLADTYNKSLAIDIGAPWLAVPPWRAQSKEIGSQAVPALWYAIMATFRRVRIREEWRPLDILHEIRDYIANFKENDLGIQNLYNETIEILSDKKRVDVQRGEIDPLGLALQLVLLRPTPDKFVTWNEELTTSRPVVWWTGAMLSGMLQGFRDLDAKFRGTFEARRVLALRTWHLMAGSGASEWQIGAGQDLGWKLTQGKFRFLSDGKVWAERNESARGKWFEANLQDKSIRGAALQLAKSQAPDLFRSLIRLADTEVPLHGAGDVTIGADNRSLSVKGSISLMLPKDIVVETDLVSDREFRAWIATGSILDRLSPPPELQPANLQEKDAGEPQTIRSSGKENVPGLTLRENFVSEEEEQQLIAAIDALPWLTDLKRRVQHYGWRYDYKARQVDADSYIGPLPEWAGQLGRRLFENGLVAEIPDQVIVNEYVGKQGISKHIDCLPCFRGSIVTISLNESWEMNFLGPKNAKVVVLLNRRSVAIMSGECRTLWKHEIPARLKEPSGNRGRRISLTFRKVNFDRAQTNTH